MDFRHVSCIRQLSTHQKAPSLATIITSTLSGVTSHSPCNHKAELLLTENQLHAVPGPHGLTHGTDKTSIRFSVYTGWRQKKWGQVGDTQHP